MTFASYLRSLNACSEAVTWAAYRTESQAWAECERADWMLWLWARRVKTYTPELRLAACACARTALRFVPDGENRPRLAIECAERYARGEASAEELREARRATAATAAYAADAADARLSTLREMTDLIRTLQPTMPEEAKT